MRVLLFIMIVLLAAQSGAARDIFVNNLSGDDTFSGSEPVSAGERSGPVRTLSKALRLARPGSRILLAATTEPYRETVTLQGGFHSGVHGDAPLVIDGQGAILDGSAPIPSFAWESVKQDLFRARCVIKSHQVVFLSGNPAERLVARSTSRSAPILSAGQYLLNDGYLYFRVDSGKIPDSYEPSWAGLTTGLTLYDVHDVIVKNLVVQGFAYDGVNAHDNVRQVRLENVTCRDNGRSGITIAGASRVMLDRCVAERNHVAQLRVEPFAAAELRDCRFDLKTAPAMEREGAIYESGVKD
jgi:hypothetical protein